LAVAVITGKFFLPVLSSGFGGIGLPFGLLFPGTPFFGGARILVLTRPIFDGFGIPPGCLFMSTPVVFVPPTVTPMTSTTPTNNTAQTR